MAGLAIGDVAERTGLAVSAIRFYEEHGIVRPLRNAGGHRRYDRADIRRLSFVMVAQRLGFPLARIAALLDELPDNRQVTKADWTRISSQFREEIDARIYALEALRDKLDGCIGCGCLSLETCALHNPADVKGQQGPGPRELLPPEGQLPG
ncbi:redox-sensitive transcriptional activator SoxR [Pseudoroseicyclus sp. CXY001]|uniref:redox-sensitive transcriptional activator SoxR n=1 Tax=Pseudoroseicyclus sp. CXY001 TaxID=3242492 RepID=UPI0035712FA2